MTIIVLTGLVVVEKVQLTQALAQHFHPQKTVAVIDNIARLEVDGLPEKTTLTPLTGDAVTDLIEAIGSTSADVIIAAVTEQAHPEKLFIALDDLREQLPDANIYTLALIDTRTCDCFPNVRQALEMYADASVMMPYNLDEVIAYVDIR